MQATHYILHHRNGSLQFRRNKTQLYTVGYRSKQLAQTLLQKMEHPPKYMLLPDNPVELYDPSSDTRLIIDSNATFFIPKAKAAKALKEKGGDIGDLEDLFTIERVDYHDFLLYPVTHGTGIVMPFFLVTEDEDEYVYRAHVIDPLPASRAIQ